MAQLSGTWLFSVLSDTGDRTLRLGLERGTGRDPLLRLAALLDLSGLEQPSDHGWRPDTNYKRGNQNETLARKARTFISTKSICPGSGLCVTIKSKAGDCLQKCSRSGFLPSPTPRVPQVPAFTIAIGPATRLWPPGAALGGPVHVTSCSDGPHFSARETGGISSPSPVSDVHEPR